MQLQDCRKQISTWSWILKFKGLKYLQNQLSCTAGLAFLISTQCSMCLHVLFFVPVIWSQVANQQVVHHYFQKRHCVVPFSFSNDSYPYTHRSRKFILLPCWKCYLYVPCHRLARPKNKWNGYFSNSLENSSLKRGTCHLSQVMVRSFTVCCYCSCL